MLTKEEDEVNPDGLALENIDGNTLDLFFNTIFGKSAKLALLAKNIDDLFYLDPLEDHETRTLRKLELCRKDQLLEFAKYMGKELPASMTKAEIIQNLVELLKGRRRGLPENRSLTAAKIRDATRKFYKIRMMGPMTDAVLARKQVLSQRGIKKIAIVLENEEIHINKETKNTIRMTWEAELRAFLDRREATAAPTDEEINSAIGKALRIMHKMGAYETLTHVQLQQQVAIILESEVIRRRVTMETVMPEYDKLKAEILHDQENAVINDAEDAVINAVVNAEEHIDGINAEHIDGINAEELNDGINAEEAEEEVEAEVAEHVAVNEAGEQQEEDDNAVANNIEEDEEEMESDVTDSDE